ncbi:MAG: hypothetical protein K5696_09500, partial [Lachnospiraceae bacterium]|nr:hypothetical protein [Lachnospiraceae bacterium]
EDDNILDGIREHISQASWEKISADFAEGREGSLTFVLDSAQESLCYAPVPDTGWMLAVLIHESVNTNSSVRSARTII